MSEINLNSPEFQKALRKHKLKCQLRKRTFKAYVFKHLLPLKVGDSTEISFGDRTPAVLRTTVTKFKLQVGGTFAVNIINGNSTAYVMRTS